MSVEQLAKRSRVAARRLAQATREEKDRALNAIADALLRDADRIIEANARDLAAAQSQGINASLLDRLKLDQPRIESVAAGVRQVAGLADPVGEVLRSSVTLDGLRIEQVRVPFGVIGMIYEARPNVTVDAAGICLKSGNAVLLRGSSTTSATNAVLVEVMRSAIEDVGLPADAIILVSSEDRDTVRALITARGLVDLVIPRGGADLIDLVVRESSVPVIETGVGNCHVYIDRTADLTKALPIVVNAKVSRPSVCNAAETLLVHSEVADAFLPAILAALDAEGVRIHADPRAVVLADRAGIEVEPATEADWFTEYGTLDLAVGVVADLDAAIEHIRTYGSGHTEAIITDDSVAARAFVSGCDSAAVMVNASTRFTDGEKFGFGAEIGISTQKLHARGPMALPEMTTTTWVVTGEGQIRA